MLPEGDTKPDPAVLDHQGIVSGIDIERVLAPGADAGAKASIKRRAPIACRRCRRMRSKCIHDKAQPPCKACEEAGLTSADCIFPVRGQPDNDREYRHPRARADKITRRERERDVHKVRRAILEATGPPELEPPPALVLAKPQDDWEYLPPLPEIIDAIHLFTRKYFQLGFISKTLFFRRLEQDHRSVSVFLLLSILSISARFSPALAQRYDGEIKAANFFMEKASKLGMDELYQEPTLERCQAFYLLSIAQQGSGMRNKSYINLGIATRMAVLMHLHREELYTLPNPADTEMVIMAESARRTLWMLHSQDNLHCGALSPISLAASDITCLLPCNEEDFAAGRLPQTRAALEDTPPARDNELLIHQPQRSLFASLIQAHYYWGKVARKAKVSTRSSDPWNPSSDYAIMAGKLANWEHRLPQDHRWSMVLLKGHKSACEDLAYMNVTMMTKLCNIVLRRPYLEEIIQSSTKHQERRHFFMTMSDELFRNVGELYEQIDAQFAVRDADESVGAQIASFCVYSCGLFSTYLCKYKNICSDKDLTRQARNMLQRTMSILMESKAIWPLASRWLESLERFSRDPRAATGMEGSMADGDDRILRPIQSERSPRSAQSPLIYGRSPASPEALKLRSPSEEDSKRNLFPLMNLSPSMRQPNQPARRMTAPPASTNTHHVPGEKPEMQPPGKPRPPQGHYQVHQQQGPMPAHPSTTAQQPPQQLLSSYPPGSFPPQRAQASSPYYQLPPGPFRGQNMVSVVSQPPFAENSHAHAHPLQHPQAAAQQVFPPQPHSSNNTPHPPQPHVFHPPQQPGQQQQQQQQQHPNIDQISPSHPLQLVVPDGAIHTSYPIPQAMAATLGPRNDGYEGELQSWFDESAQVGSWVGHGMGVNYF